MFLQKSWTFQGLEFFFKFKDFSHFQGLHVGTMLVECITHFVSMNGKKYCAHKVKLLTNITLHKLGKTFCGQRYLKKSIFDGLFKFQ